MKQFLFILLAFSICSQPLIAQDSIPKKDVFFKAKIKSSDGDLSDGYLYAITDSSIFLSRQKKPLKFFCTDSSRLQSLNYKEMRSIEIYKRGKTWRTTLTTMAIGAVVGALIGASGGDDSKDQWFAYTAADKAGAGALIGVAVGSITGAIIGLASRKIFFIHQKRERYQKMRNNMMTIVGN